MSLEVSYLLNLMKRAEKGEVSFGELGNLARLIDKLGDGDGLCEMSDVIDAGREVGSELLDKAGNVLELIENLF